MISDQKTATEERQDPEFGRKLLTVAGPIAFQSLMLASVAAADAVMLGSVEQNSMAAVSLATQIQFVQNMVISSFVSGASILGAQYWGKGDRKTLDELFAIIIRLCGVFSLLCFIGCRFFPQYLMLFFTGDEALIAIGVRYLKIAGWSYLLTGISQCYLAMMKVTEHPASAAKISTGAVLINIVLNAFLIYGLFGLPAMGAEGAALATLISRIVELGWAVLLSLKKDYLALKISCLFHRVGELEYDFGKVVLPILGASLMWGIGFTAYTAFMGHLGADSAAANSVASVIRDLLCCFCNGLSAGGGILIGNELGAGHLEKARWCGDRLTKMSFLCGVACTAVMLMLTPAVLHFVKLTDKAQSYLLGMMVIMAVYMIGRCVNTIIINGIFSAGGDTAFDMYSLAVCMWCLAVPLAAAGTFLFRWPVLVVYSCTCLDEVGKIPWVMYHYRKYRWVKDLTRAV